MIFLSLILMEIILYMIIHHSFINYFIQLALIHYPPHACMCHEWRGKRSKGDLCSDRADLLLQMVKSCLILPPAIKISKSFAIFLMSLIFHSLISFIFLLRLLNTNFATWVCRNTFMMCICKALFRILAVSCIKVLCNFRDTEKHPKWSSGHQDLHVSINSRVVLNKFPNHSRLQFPKF